MLRVSFGDIEFYSIKTFNATFTTFPHTHTISPPSLFGKINVVTNKLIEFET